MTRRKRRGSRWCAIALVALALVYALSLGLFLIGTVGLFDQPRDPLAGVYLIPLGWPWNRLVDLTPEPLWPWLAAAAPLVNLAVLAALCGWLRRRLRDEDAR